MRRNVLRRKHLNEMSNYRGINLPKDFIDMVFEYLEYEPDAISDGMINYGEIDGWVEMYPELCELCMAGDNEVADAADELVDAIYNFCDKVSERKVKEIYNRG